LIFQSYISSMETGNNLSSWIVILLSLVFQSYISSMETDSSAEEKDNLIWDFVFQSYISSMETFFFSFFALPSFPPYLR